jgi:2'-5' RNA ligase
VPRLFVAVWPPDEVLDLLASLPRPAVPGVRWTNRDQWHVTLRFLGQVKEVQPVAAALAGMVVAPVTARLGPAVDRFGRRILHVPVAGLDQVAAAVVRATRHLGRPPDDRPFHGHITLARAANVDLRALTGVPVEARWPVDSIGLVESRLSPAGPRYEVLAQFPSSFPNR